MHEASNGKISKRLRGNLAFATEPGSYFMSSLLSRYSLIEKMIDLRNADGSKLQCAPL